MRRSAKGRRFDDEFRLKKPPQDLTDTTTNKPPSPLLDKKPPAKEELDNHPLSETEETSDTTENEDQPTDFVRLLSSLPSNNTEPQKPNGNDETEQQGSPPTQATAATIPHIPMAQRLPESHNLSFKNQVYDYDEWRRRNNFARVAPIVHGITNERANSGSIDNSGGNRDLSATSVTAQLVVPESGESSIRRRSDLESLYPGARVVSVKIFKPIGPVNLALKTNSRLRVEIKEIRECSIFKDTDLKEGQLLLAINGCRVETLRQAVEMIRSVLPGASLAITTRENVPMPDTCKLAVEPCFRHTPGVAFADCHYGQLARIARVFESGPFFYDDGMKVLERRDIVLSVNGVPVSNSQDARAAMRRSLQRGFITDIYVVDHNRLVEKVEEEAKQRFQAPKDMFAFMVDDDLSLKVVIKGNQSFELGGFQLCPTSYMIRDESSAIVQQPVDQSENTTYKKSHKRAQNCKNFASAFNQEMTRYLDSLAEVVCCESWRHEFPSFDSQPSTVEKDVAQVSLEMAEVLGV